MISSGVLIGALPKCEVLHWQEQAVRDVVCDSRQVQPGDLFVAIPGVAVDGHRFAGQALAAGAVAFVVERPLPELAGQPTAVVPNAREAYAYLQAALHDHPGRKMRVIGVTGTDGKTTTVRLIRGMLAAAGLRVGSVDTVAAQIGARDVDTGFHTTTPAADEVQRYLAEMVSAGADVALLEATSEGLAQHRVTACEVDVAVVTNITHDHLYFHGTYEAYREAKALLFRALATAARKEGVAKVAVLNADDSSYGYLRAIPADRQLTYGLGPGVDVGAEEIVATPHGLRFTLRLPGEKVSVASALVGRYNVPNILAAAAAAHSQGVSAEAIAAGVAAVQGVPGRTEYVAGGQPFTVIIDFAHTANALDAALRAAREFTAGRLIAVYGCAGLRDVAKRPVMGEASGRLADLTVLTAEDPRTESVDAIIAQIAAGCRRAGRAEGEGYLRVPDRGEAIAEALSRAQPGDTVMICGKGHERSMCFGTTEYPWSDHEATVAALRRLGYSA
ncbi:MAG: UDP-N-acetylmuramoyl-L-alanyl-D-glutamate--2,6-diaminopimelate ligase [Chloroflexi bacterium]|nr:UDP-N-acetylmuramoyl-L-alanyl-D-glutamate--2,6-diaminopimelate ligase [Chloroflexota bacterium]